MGRQRGGEKGMITPVFQYHSAYGSQRNTLCNLSYRYCIIFHTINMLVLQANAA